MVGRVVHDLERDGIAVLPDRIGPEHLPPLAGLFAGCGAGGRMADELPEAVANLLGWPPLRTAIDDLDPTLRPVRVLLFNKNDGANWFVPWHQDAAVAVRGNALEAGFSKPTLKDGVPHFEAPDELLRRMLNIRVHVDPAGETDGPLEAAVGTHQFGTLGQAAAHEAVARAEVRVCTAASGELHLLRPLLIHRSRKAVTPSGRRTVQIEFAPADWLPEGLEWWLSIPPATLPRAA